MSSSKDSCFKIKFFPRKEACTFKPWPADQGLQITDNEIKLADSIAEETTDIAGTPVDFYYQDLERSVVDPLFREPIERAWSGPYKLKAFVEWADSVPETREEGLRSAFSSRAWIPRVAFEAAGLDAPAEGDILRFWNIPFFNDKIPQSQTVIVTGITRINPRHHRFFTR